MHWIHGKKFLYLVFLNLRQYNKPCVTGCFKLLLPVFVKLCGQKKRLLHLHPTYTQVCQHTHLESSQESGANFILSLDHLKAYSGAKFVRGNKEKGADVAAKRKMKSPT